MTGPSEGRVNRSGPLLDSRARTGDHETMTNATTLEMIRKQAEDAMDGPAPDRPAAPPDTSCVCPYCGHRERANAEECSECRGLFEPLSRIATQNAMGPWQLRDEANPFRPGCSIETLRALISRGKLTRETVLRGPATKQFWKRAGEIRGVSHFLGLCYSCKGSANAKDHFCRSCGASFVAESDRNWLGLDAVRPIASPPVSASVETEPKTRQDRAEEQPVAATAPPATGGFVDLFGGPPSASSSASAAPMQRVRREKRQRAVAVRQAVAAATIALCAAALSVAIWAASAAQAVNSQKAAADEATEPVHEADGTARVGEVEGVVAESSPTVTPAADTQPIPESWHARLQAASALGESDDIESLEEAVVILRQLAREAPQAAASEGLADQIERIERRVDDLTIRKFLRKGS